MKIKNASSNSDPLSGLEHFTARELQQMALRPPDFIVDGILPEGTTLVVSKPKVGKTNFALNIASAIASGSPVFDTIYSKQGRVLFLALEGTKNGIQERLRRMLDGKDFPEDLEIVREFDRLDEGGIDRLESYIHFYPDTRLIVIDTLVCVRSQKTPRRGLYELDYQAVQPLSQLSVRKDISIVVLHHANKRDEGEALDFVSGTTGLTGAVDNVLLMEKYPLSMYGQYDVTVTVAAREVEGIELAFSFDPERAMWIPKGEAWQMGKTPERQAILDAISDAGRPLKPKEIAAILGKKENSVRVMLRQMFEAGELVQPAYGLYDIPTTPP